MLHFCSYHSHVSTSFCRCDAHPIRLLYLSASSLFFCIEQPVAITRAFGVIKKCAARLNARDGLLDASIGAAIEQAAGEVASGKLDDHFPLVIYQT